jgi:DNA-binding XRE family transcriptional regulator
VLLVSEYKQNELDQTILPRLRAFGFEPRVVDLKHKGPLEGYSAVLFMFQQCNHAKHDSFKGRAKLAGIPFVLLTRETVTWPVTLRRVGLKVLDAPMAIEPAPLPPSPLLPEAIPEAIPVVGAAPEIGVVVASSWGVAGEESVTSSVARPFHATLAEERVRAGLTQPALAKRLGVSRLVLANWERRRCMPTRERYGAICALFPGMVEAPPPRYATSPVYGERLAPVMVVPPVARRTAKVTPAPPPPKSAIVPKFPLDAIRKAARALNLTGSLDVKVNLESGTAKVTVSGETPWEGRSATEAVTNCRLALEKRLRERCSKLQTEEETIRAVLADLAA